VGKANIGFLKFNELNEEGKEVARKWWKQEMLDDFYASNWNMIENVVIQYAKDNGIEFSEEYCIDYDYDGDIYLRNATLKEAKLIEIVNNALDENSKKTFKFLLDNQVLLLDNEVSGRTIDMSLEGENYSQNEVSQVVVEVFEKTITKVAKNYVETLISELENITQKEMEKYKENSYVDKILVDRNYEFTKDGIKQ
jgi:hypothetical protein